MLSFIFGAYLHVYTILYLIAKEPFLSLKAVALIKMSCLFSHC